MENSHDDTAAYFDDYTPEYSVGRLSHAAAVVNRYGHEQSSLVDIGCGTGNTLEFVRNETGLTNLYGIDVSQKCLLKAKDRVGCQILLGSILDASFIEEIPRRFDFALLSAVLHHLIGKTRRESRNLASLAIQNSLSLLKNDGYLIVMEPTFCPSIVMDIIFYLKKLTTRVTSRRISLLGKWINIGAPVVSYYTNENLVEIISAIKHCQIIEMVIKEKKLSPLYRLVLIMHRTDTTIVVRKTGCSITYDSNRIMCK